METPFTAVEKGKTKFSIKIKLFEDEWDESVLSDFSKIIFFSLPNLLADSATILPNSISLLSGGIKCVLLHFY